MSAPAPDPLVVLTRNGLYVPDAELYLDARSAPGTVFVSHAHADHCSAASRILCTPETAALHAARRGARDAVELRFGERLRVGDATVTLQSAGHALGSAMLVADGPRGRVAYTGDYKLRVNPFTPPVEIPRCDTLVMECTFGEPRYRFPTDAELLARLFGFIDQTLAQHATPVVLAYALGKGQEALYHLTGAGYDVVLHGAIANMCDLHEKLGYTFPGPGRWSRYRKGDIGDRVLITTPSTRKTAMVQKLPAKRIVYLTGWAYHPGAFNIYKDCDLVLPISDHADFDELVRTAVESGASKIYTVHGMPGFSAHLRSLGLDAEHLAEHPNTATDVADCEGPEATEAAPPPVVLDAQLGFDL
jgi:Cft2 family RNA processing exonuclease